jgi:hypothetical protein
VGCRLLSRPPESKKPTVTTAEQATGKGIATLPKPLMSLHPLFHRYASVVLYSHPRTARDVPGFSPLIYGIDYGRNNPAVRLCCRTGSAGV